MAEGKDIRELLAKRVVRPPSARMDTEMDKAFKPHEGTAPAEPAGPVEPGIGAASPIPHAPQGSSNPDTMTLDDLKGGNYSDRFIYEIPLPWVDYEDMTFYNREAADELDLTSLVESLKENGQMVPGRVRVNEAGRIQIIDCWRRALALRKIGATSLLAIISKKPLEEEAKASLIVNIQRKDIPDYHKWRKLQEYHERFGLSLEEIGEKTGVGKRQYIHDCLKIFKVAPVEAFFKNGKLTLSQSKHLAMTALRNSWNDKKTELMGRRIISQEMQLKELRFLEGDKKKGEKKDKKRTWDVLSVNEEGTRGSYRFKFAPETTKRDLEKAIDAAQEFIRVLKNAIRSKSK